MQTPPGGAPLHTWGDAHRRNRRIARTGALISAGALVCCVLVAWLAYQSSRAAVHRQTLAVNEGVSRNVVALASVHAPRTGGEASLLEFVDLTWASLAHPHEGSYLCVIGPSSRLLSHTKAPQMVGTDVGAVLLPDAPDGLSTVSDLIQRRSSWSGLNRNQRGIEQLVSYSYLPALDGLVVVHTPTLLIRPNVLAVVGPWSLGLATVALLLLPAAVILFARVFHTACRGMDDETAALLLREQRFRRMADALPELVWTADPEGRDAWFNRTWLEFRGRTMVQEIADGRMASIHPDDLDPYREAFREALEARRPIRAEYRLRRGDGEYRWVLDTGVPWTAPDGAFAGYIGSSVDITDRREAEQRRRARERQWRTIVENMPVLLDASDGAGNTVFWNRECERVTGYTSEEVVGRADGPARAFANPGHGREPAEAYRDREQRLICPDGTERTIAWSSVSALAPIPGWANWRIGVEVTERKLAEAARLQLEADLQQTQKLEAIGTLAAGVAHEVNNALTAVLGYVSVARRRVGCNDEAQSALQGIETVSRHTANVVQSLLSFSRRRTDDESEATDLSRVLDESVTLLKRILPANTEIVLDLVPSAPVWVKGSAAELQQIIMNLAVNARDAMQGGGTVRVTLDRAGLPGFVDLTVDDDGCGMAEHVRQRIFDPFFTTKPRGEGTGLGLSIVHSIVERHHGSIQVDSAVGRGTCFRIRLATCEAADDVANANGPHEAPAGERQTVLIVEDNQQVLAIVAATLEAANYRVLRATDGEAAMRLFGEHDEAIDLMVVDLGLPGIRGDELVRLVRARRDVPTIVITGNGTSGLDDATLLHKPFGMEQLVELVGTRLRQEEPQRA